MLVTPSGMATVVSLEQREKALLPIVFKLLGKVTEVRSEHILKALSPMPVTAYVLSPLETLSGMVMSPSYLFSPLVTTTVPAFWSAML